MNNDKQLYDFYYSPETEWRLKRAMLLQNKAYVTTYFNGKPYTECIIAGRSPVANHANTVYIGTVTMNDVNY